MPLPLFARNILMMLAGNVDDVVDDVGRDEGDVGVFNVGVVGVVSLLRLKALFVAPAVGMNIKLFGWAIFNNALGSSLIASS